MLRAALERVMVLQKSYTSKLSDPMKERSKLVRREIRGLLEESQYDIATAVGVKAERLVFVGSDGVGQKTPYCWIRFASLDHSPNPRTGWYAVFLFEMSGSMVYLSLNQGTTTWDGTAFVHQDPGILKQRVRWARGVLNGDLKRTSLNETIVLGGLGKKDLGRAYERGNVAAFRYLANAVPTNDDLRTDVIFMSNCLGRLYQAQSRV
jgi:hypothetical protein